MVNVLGRSGISVPFPNVETEESFVGVCLRDLDEACEVFIKISD